MKRPQTNFVAELALTGKGCLGRLETLGNPPQKLLFFTCAYLALHYPDSPEILGKPKSAKQIVSQTLRRRNRNWKDKNWTASLWRLLASFENRHETPRYWQMSRAIFTTTCEDAWMTQVVATDLIPGKSKDGSKYGVVACGQRPTFYCLTLKHR